MNYCIALFIMLLSFLKAATVQESLENLNSFLSLYEIPKIIFQSEIGEDVRIGFSCKHRFSPGTVLIASKENPMVYNERAYKEKFTVTNNDPVFTVCEIVLKNECVAYPYVSRVFCTRPSQIYFDVVYDHLKDYQGKCNEVLIKLKKNPVFMLKIPRYDFLIFNASSIDTYDYLDFFKCHLMLTFGSFDRYYQSIQQNFNSFFKRQSEISHTSEFRIPLNIFTVWLTHPNNPQGLSDASKKMIKETRNNCSSAFGWKHYLCVHRISDNPSITSGENIIEISTLMNEPAYRSVKEKYEAALEMRNWGMASDIARLVVLHKFGGVYQDTDVAIMQSPKRLHQLCDFYAGIESPKALAPGNAIMASRAGHPIITKYLDFVARGCDDLRLPENLSDPVRRTLFETGPYALARAYFTARTEWDVILPPHIFYLPTYMSSDNGYKPRDQWPLCAVARHEHAMEWIDFK